MINRYFFILLLISNLLYAQVNDDFSDGDFNNNPSWSGDENHFEVNSSKQLHLKSSGSDTSYLSTESACLNNSEWNFWVKHSFNSSGNNFSRIYIASDCKNLKGGLNGYFVQIGSSDDNISLCRQDNNIITEIISGANVFTGNSVNELRIKVIRDTTGNWELYCDNSGGEIFQKEGEGFDNIHNTSTYLGVFCKYTSSNATKFYFDDFYAGPIVIDTIPPRLSGLKVIDADELEILFTEMLDSTSVKVLSNYFVDNGIGEPVEVTLNPAGLSSVNLLFGTSFIPGMINTIRIINIKDMAGNILKEEYREFSFYEVEPFDIVINEIMADPDPPRDLPVTEYIELFNKTGLPINLENWKIEFGSSSKTFPDITIEASGYLIICKDKSLNNYGQVAEILTSSSSLSNEGTTITLKNESNNIISTVSYKLNWYGDKYKEKGGWSLEQIDPYNPCGGKTNWKASVDMEGGTPGRENSVNATNPDNNAPGLLRVGVINEKVIQLYFNEPLDSSSIIKPSNYIIDNNISISGDIIPVTPDFSSVILSLKDSLKRGIIYYLSINDTITDCVGNILPLLSSIKFALPENIEYTDVIINEVLFNPADHIVNGNDFVEIYNRSSKVIDLKDMLISSVNPASLITTSAAVSERSFLLFPEDYLVLTKDAEVVMIQYYTSNREGFLEVEPLPAYNNDEGIVEISLPDGTIIDRFSYHDNMHFDLLKSTDGISLERINPDRPSSEPTNWHSASEASGFATPAYQNSVYSNFEAVNGKIEVSPQIFSPGDVCGRQLLDICYTMNEAGFVANIGIYNSKGMLIRQLKRNELLGTSGCFTWDGVGDDGKKPAIGIYIILFEVFSLPGKVERYKETCVLGGRL